MKYRLGIVLTSLSIICSDSCFAEDKLSSPAAGKEFTVGQYIQILPPTAAQNANEKPLLIKYYLQGSGRARLLFKPSFQTCGLDKRTKASVKGSNPPGQSILLPDYYADGSQVLPGSFRLIITRGSSESSLYNEKIIASSDNFVIKAGSTPPPPKEQKYIPGMGGARDE